MTSRRFLTKTWLHLAAMTVVLLLIGWQYAPEPHAHARAELNLSSSLLVDTRETLRVCALLPYEDHDAATTALEAGLTQVQQHPDWASAAYGNQPPALESDCHVTLPDKPIERGTIIGPGITETPGPYRTVLIVLDDASANRHLGKADAVLVPYELMKVGDHDAATVTTALVVRAAFLNSSEFTELYLPLSLGLSPKAELESSDSNPDARK